MHNSSIVWSLLHFTLRIYCTQSHCSNVCSDPPTPAGVLIHALPVGWNTKDEGDGTLCQLDPLGAGMHGVAILLWNNNAGLREEEA